MQAFIQRLIREAVSEFGMQTYSNEKKSLDRMYFPREKLLSLILKIYKRYGYAGAYDEGVKTSYDRVLTALQNDPDLEHTEVDQFFVGDFMSSLLQNKIAIKQPITAAKAISALHGAQVRTGNLPAIIAMVAQYDRQNSMRAGKEVAPTDELVLFYKLRLRGATHDQRNRPLQAAVRGPIKNGTCTFEDQKGNWFKKVGAPPAIHMRVSVGKGKILTRVPYEMREGDVFTFRGKVVRTMHSSNGHVINVIDGVQPV